MNLSQVREFMQVFEQEIPEFKFNLPPSKEIRMLRAKLILEEAFETVAALGFTAKALDGHFEIYNNCEIFPDRFVLIDDKPYSPKDILDGLCDLEYVGPSGTALACGFSEDIMEKAFAEVHRSNMSKLWTPEEVYLDNFKNLDDLEHLMLQESFKLDTRTFKHKGCRHEWEQDEADFYCKKCKKDDMECAENLDRCWLVKDQHGKVIKSSSYSPANLEQFLK